MTKDDDNKTCCIEYDPREDTQLKDWLSLANDDLRILFQVCSIIKFQFHSRINDILQNKIAHIISDRLKKSDEIEIQTHIKELNDKIDEIDNILFRIEKIVETED